MYDMDAGVDACPGVCLFEGMPDFRWGKEDRVAAYELDAGVGRRVTSRLIRATHRTREERQ
jgi:hypothetical protein